MEASDKKHARDIVALMDGLMVSRKSTRAFLPDPISKQTLLEILDVARSAPSNSNLQPWQVYVLAGRKKEELSAALAEAHQHKSAEYAAGYLHVPDPLPPRYQPRQDDFAANYYGLLKIDRSDAHARHCQTGSNYEFFGAPIGLLFTIDDRLERGSWLDYGMFIQNVMIAAKARGIDTCPQVSFAKYHALIRKHLPIDAAEILVCGMSMGYASPDATVNRLRTRREPVSSFTGFFGFD